MSKQMDIILEFRKRLDKRLDETIERYENHLANDREKIKDPIRKAASEDFWKSKIESIKWAKTEVMVTESDMLAWNLENELDEFKAALAK